MRVSARRLPGMRLEVLAVAGQKFVAERRGHADAAIGRRAAAEADEDFPRAALRRVAHELAGAEGIRAQRSALLALQPPQARRPRSCR